MSIQEVLAIMPSGATGSALSLEELGIHLAAHYATEECKSREARHALRDALMTDGGTEHMKQVIDKVFTDRDTADKYKAWVQYSRHNNAFKRIIGDLSSVYSAPATRSIANGNETYQQLLKEMQFDVVMQQVNKLFNAHQVLLAAPRVRKFPGHEPDAVLDVVTPANFRVVLHPNDNSLPIGWLTRTDFRSARAGDGRSPTWLLETPHESMMLDDKMMPIDGTEHEHGLGTTRWVPLTRLPNRAGFYPGEEGEDLVSASITIWLNGIFANKETKSANKQPLLAGDTTSETRRQAADSEKPIELGEGNAMTTLDMGVDTQIFHRNADHALGAVGHNYGFSNSQIKNEGVQSAEAKELQRVPLKELRAQQGPMFEQFERRLAMVKSKLLNAEGYKHRFDATGWRISHNDPAVVLSRKESREEFEERKRLGLDNTVDFLMREDRDIKDDAEAWAIIDTNIEVETLRLRKMQEQQQMGASASTPVTETVQQTTQRERSIADDETATAAQAGREQE